MRSLLRISLLCLLLALPSGCAHKTLVALVPDPDGEVGSVTVSNPAGTVNMFMPYEATTVTDVTDRPQAPKYLGRERIQKMFKEVLFLRPDQARNFLLCFVNDTEFTAESRKTVPAIVAAIHEKGLANITVVGHADTLATRWWNADLSIDRALAAKELLVSHGVDASTILIYGQGEEVPLVPTADEVYEPRNRCAEVIVR